jgi:hypothetical protein
MRVIHFYFMDCMELLVWPCILNRSSCRIVSPKGWVDEWIASAYLIYLNAQFSYTASHMGKSSQSGPSVGPEPSELFQEFYFSITAPFEHNLKFGSFLQVYDFTEFGFQSWRANVRYRCWRVFYWGDLCPSSYHNCYKVTCINVSGCNSSNT